MGGVAGADMTICQFSTNNLIAHSVTSPDNIRFIFVGLIIGQGMYQTSRPPILLPKFGTFQTSCPVILFCWKLAFLEPRAYGKFFVVEGATPVPPTQLPIRVIFFHTEEIVKTFIFSTVRKSYKSNNSKILKIIFFSSRGR